VYSIWWVYNVWIYSSRSDLGWGGGSGGCIHTLSTHHITIYYTCWHTPYFNACIVAAIFLTISLETCRRYCVKFNYSRRTLGCFLFFWRNSPLWTRASSFTRILDHTQRRTTVGRTPLDEWSARRRDFYLTTHNTHNIQTSMLYGGIRTHNFSRWAAADLRLRLRGHWDGHLVGFCCVNVSQCTV